MSRRPSLPLLLLLAAGLWAGNALLPAPARGPLSASGVAHAQDDAELQQLLQENDRLTLLEDDKDSEDALRLKLANLQAINESRVAAGRSPVKLDLLASRVGNKHCVDMVIHQYMGV